MGMNARQNRTILFVHIPKCAGTTLRVLFIRQYAQQPWYIIRHDIPSERAKLAAMPESERLQHRMIFGHQCWGWHKLIPQGRACCYTTMLRDPIERVLSLYAHCKLSEHYLGPAIGGKGLEWYLTSGVTMRADNGMVRQLCGEDEFIKQEPYDDMRIPLGGVKDHHLAAAIQNLNKCALVGTTERFDNYLDAGRAVFGWRFGAYQRVNVTRWPRPTWRGLNRNERIAVEKATALDRVLYEHAQKIGA